MVRASKSRKATRHDDEIALSALVVSIGVINLWNRLNVATPARQGVAPRAQAIHGLRQFAMLASIGSRLLTIAAQI